VEVVLQLCIPCCNLFNQSRGLCNQKWIMHACMHIYTDICNPIPTRQSIPMTIVNLCADYSCTLHFSLNSSIFLYSFEHPPLGSLHVWDSSMLFFLSCTVCKNYGVVETHDRRQVWNWKVY
jgi:hypothetical protein